jgi:hypothetical protein
VAKQGIRIWSKSPARATGWTTKNTQPLEVHASSAFFLPSFWFSFSFFSLNFFDATSDAFFEMALSMA